jgi:UDP-N-acetylglucosamine acyltransferase
MARIHPTAVVEPGARFGANVVVGPFSVVGPEVVLGDDVILHSHAIVQGRTTIGAGSQVYPFASLGQPGQIYKNQGQTGSLDIGLRCEIREHVTINCGSPKGDMFTRIGEDTMLMVGAHVAHDCQIGRGVIFANNATLGGHVDVGDGVFLGGLCAIHQFTRIGAFAMISGTTGVRADVIPFGYVAPGGKLGGFLAGLNVIGMKRRGMTGADLKIVRAAYKELFFGEGVFAERLDRVAASASHAAVKSIVDFIRAGGVRELTLPNRRQADDDGD